MVADFSLKEKFHALKAWAKEKGEIIMKNMGCIIFASILLLLAVVGSAFFGVYNRLQTMDETVNSQWAQIENQLQRRNDLIPNLVNTVKGYATHEEEIFTAVADARAKLSGAIGTGNVKAVQEGANQLNGALARLLGVVENYPNLKADKVFMGLQDELAGTENRISVARMDYNNSVRDLNSEIRRFPINLIAGISGIKARDYFEITPGANAVPEVKF